MELKKTGWICIIALSSKAWNPVSIEGLELSDKELTNNVLLYSCSNSREKSTLGKDLKEMKSMLPIKVELVHLFLGFPKKKRKNSEF